jgi:hypothetical protein
MAIRFPLRRTLLLGFAVVAAGVMTTGVSTAAHPFAAGEPSSHAVTLPGTASARALERVESLGRALGLASGVRKVERVEDGFEHATYDQVTTTDARGRPSSIVRLTLDGRLALAVGLGLHESATRMDVATAVRRAGAVARAAGLTLVGAPRATPSSGAGGWSVSWPRVVDGVRVRGDGVRVALWSDGTFHSISAAEHPLAAHPEQPALEAQARAAATAFVAVRFGPAAPALGQSGATLAWVAPNDTFDAALPDAPAQTMRLAWVVEYRATGALAERVTAIEVWLDAATLAVIGGDVAE